MTMTAWCMQKLFLDFLPGKVCVITGGGRGVGQGIAEKYASFGFTLILTARSRDQLEQVAVTDLYLLCIIIYNQLRL